MALQLLLILLEGLDYLASAATIAVPFNRRSGSNSLQLLPDTTGVVPTLFSAIPGGRSSLENTSLTVSEPQCLPQLGTNIDPASCRNAIRKIPRSTRRITLGWRGKGNFDITLPYIWTSDDGTCSVFIVGRFAMRPDIYSFLGLSEDADQIQQKCVGDPNLRQGGLLPFVGRANQLTVQIARTDVHVECDNNPAPPYTSCRSVLDTMPWDWRDRIFGAGGQYQLPFLVPAFDGQCVFQITANGAAATAQWAVIFTAIAQVDEICLKQGKSGHAYHVGNAPYLTVSIAQRHEINVS